MSEPFPPPEEVLDFLKRYDRYLLFGHIEPDGDCVASQLALGSFLGRRGKQVSVFSHGPFDRPEIRSYERLFRKRIKDSDLEGSTAGVILDCSTADRIGPMGVSLGPLPILVVDHHASGEHFGDVRWVVPRAPSVTYLIQRLIEEFPDTPTKTEAGLLLFGLARDTGFFRHLTENSGFVFLA
ncbi:MAG: DHH family phosphoesterase, partial [Spirochaetales bacterium]|nr:DHH family phosphoesterase [Spirochaetales bacterium]